MATLNNVIANANGSVGIGTSIPTQLLELKKTTGSSIALLNYNDSVKFNINASSGGAGYVGMVTNHDLIFVTNDTERARLNTNGNLGIGSSSPAYKLDVTGEMRQSGNNFWFSGARMAGDGSGNIDINYNNGSSPSFTWYNGGTSALARITSAGNLGIGTTTVATKCVVAADATDSDVGQFRVIGSTSNAKLINVGYHTTNNYGFIQALIAGTGYSPLAIQPNGGCVGIGTSTTTSGLQIQTEGTNTTSGSFLFVRSTNASFGGGAIGVGYQYAAAVGNNFTPFRIRAGTTNAIFVVNSAGVVYAGDTTGAVIYGNHDPYFAFNQDTNTGMDWAASDTLTFKTGGSERVRIDSSGQLGVGTTSPLNRLEVAGSTFNRATFKATANVQTGIQIIRTGGVSNTDWEIYSPASSTDLRFFNVADLFTFQVTGNLGIGTNSPLTKLHVNGQTYINNVGASASTQLTFNSNGANYAHFYDVGVGLNTLAIGGASGISSAPSTAIMSWGLTSGNVGIGTTTLSSLLTLNGTYPQIIANNPTTGSGVVIQLRDNGRDAGFMGHSTTTARLQFGSRGSSAVHMTIGETGNIGIGSTSPGAKLDIRQTSAATGLRVFVNDTSTTNIAQFIGYDNTLGDTTRMVVQAGGNVGIGTTSPGAKLQVSSSASTLAASFRGNVGVGNLSSYYYGLCSLTKQTSGLNLNIMYASLTSGYGEILMSNYNDNTGASGYASYIRSYSNPSGDYSSYLTFGTSPISTGGPSERMRITAAGYVGIGTSNTNPYSSLFPAQLVIDSGTSDVDGIFASTNNSNAAELILVKKSTTNNYGSLLIKHAGTSGDAIEVEYGINTSTGEGGTNSFKVTTDGTGYFRSSVGIGTTSPVALLDVRGSTKFGSSLSNTHQFTGSVNFGGSTYNNSIAIDKFEYFSLQPYIEGGSFPSNVLSLSGTYPTFVTMTGSACPFGKVAYNVSYYEAIGDFIPVQAGETLYGEIWAYRTTSATGTAGGFYCGVARYDKDKRMIDSNIGLTYFITNNGAVTVPTTSTWTKYSGTTTLPLTHTPYAGSDGGPVRYVRPYIIVNYTSGTIPTYWAAWKIRKQQLTRDAGATTISGSLGIGTSSPSSILHTAGAGDQVVRFTHTDNVVGRALTLRLTNNNATYLNSGAYVQAIQGAGIDYYSLAFGTTNNSTTSAERMRIQYDGNVGIGTTSPDQKLSVISGSLRVASSAYGSAIYFGKSGTDESYIKRDNSYDLVLAQNESSGNGLYLAGAGSVYVSIDANNNETAAAFVVQNNAVKSGTELFRVMESGNVGIGSSSPSAKLDVVDTGNFFVTRDANAYPRFTVTNGSAQLGLFRTGTSAGGFYIGGDASLFSVWDTSFSRLVNINTSGNIGINVASPLTKLDIANTQANGITMRYDTTTNYQAWIRPYWNSSTDTRIDFAINRISGVTPDVIMSVGYAGNVGIGTTTPAQKLTVNNNSTGGAGAVYPLRVTGGLMVNANDATGIQFVQRDAFNDYGGYIRIFNTQGTPNYLNPRLEFGVQDTDTNLFGSVTTKMSILGSGNVGIGTTSPASILHLNGTAPTILTLSSTSYPSTYLSTFGVDSGARAFLIFGNNGENQIRAGRTTTGGYLDFYTNNTVAQTTLASDGNFVMRLTSTGNVGIGTQTTSDKLEVEGGIRIRSANSLTLRNSTNDSSAVIYNGFGAGGSTIYLAVGPSPSMVIGNTIGIGTTSPGGLLHNYRATSTATPITYIQEAASSPSKTNILLIERLNNLSATNISASSAGVRIRDHSSNYGLSVEDHSGNSYLVVRGGGNVGIGTAIPTSKLNAYGSGSNLSVFKAEGGNGTLFEVTDTLTGSLFSVNTIAGLPVVDVISNYRTYIYGPTAISASINTNSNVGNYIVGMGSTTTSQHALNIVGYNANGGTGYQGFLRVTNDYSTAVGRNKYFRLNSLGSIEIINSNYGTNIFTLTDSGSLQVPTAQALNVVQLRNTGGGLKIGNYGSLFDDGNFHIHSTAPGNNLWVNVSGSGNFVINGQTGATGGVGIGTSTMSGYVTVKGSKSVTIGAYGYLISTGSPPTGTGAGTTANYSITCTDRVQATEFDATSDERLKNIQGEIPLNEAVDFVNKVKPIKYIWKDSVDKSLKTGYSAQQAYKVGFEHLTALTSKPGLEATTDIDGFVSPQDAQFVMNYEQVTPYHSKLIKHLLDKIEQLEARISQLENK